MWFILFCLELKKQCMSLFIGFLMQFKNIFCYVYGPKIAMFLDDVFSVYEFRMTQLKRDTKEYGMKKLERKSIWINIKLLFIVVTMIFYDKTLIVMTLSLHFCVRNFCKIWQRCVKFIKISLIGKNILFIIFYINLQF